MEGYLVRIPTDAWHGDSSAHSVASSASTHHRRSRPRRSSRRARQAQAQLLYYELSEGYLRGYAAPGDTEPVHVFPLTSFHIDVDVMYATLMLRVSATSKAPVGGRSSSSSSSVIPAAFAGIQSSYDNDSSDDEDGGSEDHDASDDAGERSMLLFAANAKLVQTWASRVLNWNRYVFGSSINSELSTDALDAAKRELLGAFERHCCASSFSRTLSLEAHHLSSAVSDKRSTDVRCATAVATGGSGSDTSSGATVHTAFADTIKSSATPTTAGGAPATPWWMFGARPTRRISSSSLRK